MGPLASLTRVDACNPLLQAHPTWARDEHEGHGISTSLTPASGHLASPFALAHALDPSGLGHAAHSLVGSGTPRSRNADTNHNHDTNYQGLNGLFLFKSVLPFVSDVSSCRSSLDYSFGIYLHFVLACIWPCRRCFCLEDLQRRRRPPTDDNLNKLIVNKKWTRYIEYEWSTTGLTYLEYGNFYLLRH